MDDTRKIGYRPDLHYTDEYESNINFKRSDDNANDTGDDNNSLIDDLLEQGDALQNIIDKLPDFIGDTIKDPIDPIIDFVKDELFDKDLERVPVELDYSYNPNDWDDWGDGENQGSWGDWGDWDDRLEFEDESENGGGEDQNLNLWDPDDDIPIKVEVHTKEEVIEKEYIKNVYDLFNDYYTNLHNIVSNFWAGLLYSIMNKDTSEINTILNNILLSSSDIKDDKKHLLDFSVKAEINRNMKLKYFANNFDAEGSIKHLKNFKATYEMRLRYAQIEKNNNPISRADQMSNNILEAMSLSYDIKYKKAYENLHRYLKSSNTILEDALQSAMQSMRSKQALIDTKGVKK